MIPKSDIQFLKDKAMPVMGVPVVRLTTSKSKAKWPDIWTELGITPTVTVTQEWAKQKAAERRKRLVHELAGHVVFGWEHTSSMESLGFSTFPQKDIVSLRIYRDVCKGILRPPYCYLKKET